MVLMYRYNAPTCQKFEMSLFVSIQHVDVSMHKPLYRYWTMPGPKHAFCKGMYRYISTFIDTVVHSVDTMVHSIDTLITVSIHCLLYRYRQGFWAKCIDTLCNVSIHASHFHDSGNFNSSNIDPKLDFHLFLCIMKD